MRTLLCLSGQVRCFEPFLESFTRRVIAHLPETPDLVAHLAAPVTTEVEGLREVVGDAEIRFEEDPTLDGLAEYSEGMDRQRHGVRGNLLQWHNLERCAALKRGVERERGPYDLVFWSRPDLYFATDLDPVQEPPDRLHVLAHDSYGGIMDRTCFGPSDVMDVRMRIGDYFRDCFHPERVSGAARHEAWNPERVLAALVDDRLAGRVARSRLISLRLRRGTEGYEVCRPSCRPERNRYDGLDDPVFTAAIRRLRGQRWRRTSRKPRERRVPLEDVVRELDGLDPAQRMRKSPRSVGLGPAEGGTP